VVITSFDPRKLRAVSRAQPQLAVGFCFDDMMLDFALPVLTRLPRRGPPREEGQGVRASALALLTRVLDANLVGSVLGTSLVGAEHTLIGRETVRRLHARGVAIGTHTLFPLAAPPHKPMSPIASLPAEVERLVELGVDWIETDDPERLLALIG